ncbi:peptide ABC transporter substrate-binding protein [Butyrivibrio sp. LC3010]|uniref:peptide ABC transporter substrate-binding protein n=1 Tax=Butyrivibrio sp. LC3010 TaxID=1280680 RepID=UPI00040E9B13|nr:peptide ABC transporter substrate-binding protein [Butyrivibrio sp. LC3010]
MSRRLGVILGFFFIHMVILSGCGSKLPDIENHVFEEAFKDDAKVFRTLYSSEVQDLHYLRTISAVDTAITANIVDALVDYDSKGNIIPGLAKSWESNDDATEWTFHLRNGIKWVDCEGEYYADVVADDFVTAAEYVNNAANGCDCQYMYSTGSVVLNAQEYYDYTSYLISPDSFSEAPKKVEASELGVIALDSKTLVYKLERPCTFFPSVLSYTSYLPICRKYLNEVGSMFARSNKNLLYNGAYILEYYQPHEKQILVKNPYYWDSDHVYIDRIENYYDTESVSIAPEQYMEGNIDKAVVSPDKLDEYMENPQIMDEIHHSRPDVSFTYFYAFNFAPNFDSKYQPENWSKAVVNSYFRKAIMASINKSEIMKIYEPYNPESLVNNTFTPQGVLSINEIDYTSMGGLEAIKERDSYNPILAKKYAKVARQDLSSEGVIFPVKVLMPYNPNVKGWQEEAYLIEKQIESTLGKDFIDINVEVGGDTGYLIGARRSGKYAFMKCRWGADYEDPQTWTEPFMDDGEYMFWHLTDNSNIMKIREEWNARIDEASRITSDIEKRMETFAQAEELILKNTIVIPLSIMNGEGYVMSKLNDFEGEYAPYGMANQRYKNYKLHEDSMNIEEYEAEYKKWLEH